VKVNKKNKRIKEISVGRLKSFQSFSIFTTSVPDPRAFSHRKMFGKRIVYMIYDPVKAS